MASKQRLNVLVVDRDEATNVELKDFLNEEGYQAFALSEPDQVVEEIKKGRFQLILKIQAFDYLQKPLEMEELRAVISAAIREKGLLVDLESRLNQVLGRRLRERRTLGELTLKQLANRTGLSVSLISQIELGKSAASMSTLHKLATALQVKMTYFFETI